MHKPRAGRSAFWALFSIGIGGIFAAPIQILILAGMIIQGLVAAGIAAAFVRGDAQVVAKPGIQLCAREARASITAG